MGETNFKNLFKFHKYSGIFYYGIRPETRNLNLGEVRQIKNYFQKEKCGTSSFQETVKN